MAKTVFSATPAPTERFGVCFEIFPQSHLSTSFCSGAAWSWGSWDNCQSTLKHVWKLTVVGRSPFARWQWRTHTFGSVIWSEWDSGWRAKAMAFMTSQSKAFCGHTRSSTLNKHTHHREHCNTGVNLRTHSTHTGRRERTNVWKCLWGPVVHTIFFCCWLPSRELFLQRYPKGKKFSLFQRTADILQAEHFWTKQSLNWLTNMILVSSFFRKFNVVHSRSQRQVPDSPKLLSTNVWPPCFRATDAFNFCFQPGFFSKYILSQIQGAQVPRLLCNRRHSTPCTGHGLPGAPLYADSCSSVLVVSLGLTVWSVITARWLWIRCIFWPWNISNTWTTSFFPMKRSVFRTGWEAHCNATRVQLEGSTFLRNVRFDRQSVLIVSNCHPRVHKIYTLMAICRRCFSGFKGCKGIPHQQNSGLSKWPSKWPRGHLSNRL